MRTALRPLAKSVLALALVAFSTISLAADDQTQARIELHNRIEKLFQEYAPRVSDVPTIAASELLSASGPAPIFVDVREDYERAISVIPGALTLEQFTQQLNQQGKNGSANIEQPMVVVYCTVGYRSGLTARQLRAQGLDARNLRGGILAWIAAGGGLLDPQSHATHQVHVYARKWAVVPADYTAQY